MSCGAIEAVREGAFQLANGAVNSNHALYQLLDSYPLASATSVLVMILVGIFFVSGADAASLVMGQADEGTPVVLARGFPYALRASSVQELLRPERERQGVLAQADVALDGGVRTRRISAAPQRVSSHTSDAKRPVTPSRR